VKTEGPDWVPWGASFSGGGPLCGGLPRAGPGEAKVLSFVERKLVLCIVLCGFLLRCRYSKGFPVSCAAVSFYWDSFPWRRLYPNRATTRFPGPAVRRASRLLPGRAINFSRAWILTMWRVQANTLVATLDIHRAASHRLSLGSFLRAVTRILPIARQQLTQLSCKVSSNAFSIAFAPADCFGIMRDVNLEDATEVYH
jgi:hypothetical protein